MNEYLEIWRKMCRIRAFETQVAQAHKAGRIKSPIYLSIGQESIPATITTLYPDWLIFPSHRNHGWFLSAGGDPKALRDELLGLETGCGKGMQGSASISIPGKLIGHDGLLSSNAALAAGYALATGKPVICDTGCGAVEEDYYLAVLAFAATKNIPILFIITSNGLSILTPTITRRNWQIANVAKGFGIKAASVDDDPIKIANILHNFAGDTPFLLEINTTRLYWHSGSGRDSEDGFDRYYDYMNNIHQAKDIEIEIQAEIQHIWK